MPAEDRLEDLLQLWEELRERGQQPRAEELCRDCPELLGELRKRIAALEKMAWLDEELEAPEVTSSRPSSQLGRADGRGRDAGPIPECMGRYRIARELGSGGFGTVYRGYDDQLQRDVAVKVPRRTRFRTQQDVDRFLAEARILAQLDHPHIVPVFDVGRTEDGLCYVVSKLVDGADLATKARSSRLAHAESARIIARVADALHHAHVRGLVHRDVKPGNILIDAAGKPYLADFGMALREEEFAQGPGFIGTPSYMSPEQARGEGHRVDGRTDVFSLAVVFYELLTGRPPFRGPTLTELLAQIKSLEPRPARQIDDAIPKELERVCLKGLSKRAADRYATAQDLAHDLDDWLQQRTGDTAGDQRPIPTALPGSGWRPTPTPPAAATPSSRVPLHVVPKGLRAFDAEDADFFLGLLPGPYDREGLPESVRFWKHRIEQTDPDKSFSVGLIYGPSGCGKSSLVRAGLVPRLAEHVVPVLVEATRDETESRLLRELRKHVPDLPDHLGLINALAAVRRGQALSPSRKILVVLDQFEQWLHARGDREHPSLAEALRQFDGRRLQVILLVRDDFAMAAARLMHQLEVRMVQGENFATVDLFDPGHARKVLASFGQAYGRLPEHFGQLTAEQNRFLDHAVQGLLQDGKVACVRLALFAEMIKGKPWTVATLKAVGGTEGIGVTFLEETFGAATANPEYRLHQQAARAVLQALLPEAGTNIRGRMRSRAELLAASGSARRPREFDALLRILDRELRLITPVEKPSAETGELDASGESHEGDGRSSPAGERVPEGSRGSGQDADGASDASGPPPTLNSPVLALDASPPLDAFSAAPSQPATHDSFYQLTHDYLVPALRNWLTRKQRETMRGRAELRLAERSEFWNAKPENRRLPALWEFLNVRWLTRRKEWSAPQQRMMRKAAGYYGLRTLLAAVVLTVLGLTAIESYGRFHARALVKRLLEATTADVPGVVSEIGLYRRWTAPLLADALTEATAAGDGRRQLHLRLATLPTDPGQTAPLCEQMLAAEPDELLVVRDALAKHREKLVSALWRITEDEEGPTGRRFRAACALAGYDSDNQRWNRIAGEVARQLASQNALVLAKWSTALRPISPRLLAPLSEMFRDRSVEGGSRRSLATMILADYAAEDPAVLADLLLDADEPQVGLLLPVIQRHTMAVVAHLHQELDKSPDPEATEQEKNHLAARQANGAAALVALGRADRAWPSLEFRRDPRLRSYLIHRLSRFLADPEALANRLEEETDDSVRAALILSLGEFADEKFSASLRASLTDRLVRLYREAPNPSVHGSTEWTLRRWNQEAKIAETDRALATDTLEGNQHWYATRHGHTMVVVRGPVEAIRIRPPGSELQRKKIRQDFAIAAKEVTVAQFRRFVDAVPEAMKVYTEYPLSDPTRAQGMVNWFDAAAYCRWLSECEGIPEEQMCYPPIPEIKDGMKMPGDYLQRSGYRLPTEAEWSYSCRAGTVTSLYFGHPESFRGDDELLEKYVWHFWNSPGHVLPGGLLKPNDLGLFDMLGNAMEWLQDDGMFNKEGVGARELDDLEDPSPVSGAHRVLRGFSMFDKPNNQQSEEPILSLSGTRQFSFGFRVARTLPPLDFDVVEQGESVWHKAELTLEGAAGPLVVRSVDRDVKVSPEQITTPASLTVTGPELLAGTVLFTVEGAAANEAYQVLGRLVPDGFRVVRTQDNSIAMKLVLIPRGEFMMGAGQEEIEQAVSAEAVSAFVPFRRSEGPRHRVRVTRPFWIGMHEVTVGQFRQFVDATGYRTEPERDARIVDGLIEGRWQPHKPGYSWREPGFPQTDEHPVVLVTWNDAVEFCKWLSEKEGEAYRLPTEAEWEYACRAGSTARWCFGDAEERLGECAWYRANSGLVPHPVGRKMPNAFGLYDVHGNVCEWCADGWSEGYYQQSSEDDPRGAEGDGPRILRGGNVWGQPIDCRSALRLADGHSGRGNQWGFRIAKTIQGGVLSPPLEIRLDRQAAAGKQTQYRILGADKPFVIRDVQGGVQITPSKGQAPALVKVVAPDRKTRPFSFVVERTDTGQTVVATGLLFSSDWDVKFYAWKPADGVTPPTDWEKVVAAPPLDQQTHPVLDIDSGQAASGTSVPSDSFAAVATTEIDLPAGRYDLWAVADDAARVFLDGRKLIDLWSPGGSSQLIEVQLSEGRHTVRAEYYQINGTAKLQVGIQPFPANEDGAKP